MDELNKSYRIAEVAEHINGQPMFKILSKIKELESQGKHIVHFEIGDPDFDTPKNINEVGKSFR